MKLLICPACWDVFKLARELRQCECGAVKGRYDDNGATAVNNGKGVSIAMGNGSLQQSMAQAGYLQLSSKNGAHRSEYCEPGNGKIEYAWVRPNDGPGNPHSRVEEDL